MPQSDKVVTACNANNFVVTVDKCVLDATHDYSTAKMVSGACAFVVNGDGNYEMTTGLDACGTELKFVQDNAGLTNALEYKVNY